MPFIIGSGYISMKYFGGFEDESLHMYDESAKMA
jgi:hypothetical protein